MGLLDMFKKKEEAPAGQTVAPTAVPTTPVESTTPVPEEVPSANPELEKTVAIQAIVTPEAPVAEETKAEATAE